MAYEEQLREPFEDALEFDETTVDEALPEKHGWGALDKVIVFGIIKRNGQVKTMPISAHSRAEVIKKIQAHAREGSLYYTDDCHAYVGLRIRGTHVVIRKETGNILDRDYINGIEGFWNYAKNWLCLYRGLSYKHFHLYLGEVCYRFNHRGEDLQPLLTKLLKTTRDSYVAHDPVRIRYESPNGISEKFKKNRA